MDRVWYVAHSQRVFGPYSEVELRQFAADGRLRSSELVNRTGSENWQCAYEVFPWMPTPEPVPLAEPVPEIQIICFACYFEMKVEPGSERYIMLCPKCGADIAVEAAKVEPAHHRDFEGVGGTLSERIQQKMHDAFAAEADNITPGEVLRRLLKLDLLD